MSPQSVEELDRCLLRRGVDGHTSFNSGSRKLVVDEQTRFCDAIRSACSISESESVLYDALSTMWRLRVFRRSYLDSSSRIRPIIFSVRLDTEITPTSIR